MAHSPPQYHGNYPPYISPNSPTINHPPPEAFHPAKKPRLSHAQISPHSSPQLTNGTIPNPHFYNPQVPQLNGNSRQSSPPPTQLSPGIGTMGPPNRPAAEKPVDINDLGDVMASSGVDLKDEEAALLRGPGRNKPATASFGSDAGRSYQSAYATSRPGYFDHYSYGHDVLSPNVPGDRASFYGAGALNQPPITPEDLEKQALEMEKAAILRRSEIEQYHLNNPFLQPAVIFQKLKKRCDRLGINLDQPREVGPDSNQPNTEPMKVFVTGPDGHQKLAALKGKSLILPPGNLTEILSLLSLSCKDRVRTVAADAARFAQGRKTTSMAEPPPEFFDIVVDTSKPNEPIVQVGSPGSSLKRTMDENGEPTLKSENLVVKKVALRNKTAEYLWDLMLQDRALQEKREQKRKERLAKNDQNVQPGSIAAAASSAPGTPGSLAENGVDATAPAKKPLTKKELKRQESNRVSEAQQHASMNTAASLALGGGRSGPTWLKGGGKSWLSSKSATNTSFAPAPRKDSIAATKAAASAAAAAAAAPAKTVQKRKFGDFREDAVGGKDLDVRDVCSALELDNKNKVALQKGWARLSNY